MRTVRLVWNLEVGGYGHCRGGVTDPGGGMVPGPNVAGQRSGVGGQQRRGEGGGVRNAGRRRSIMSSMGLALASR